MARDRNMLEFNATGVAFTGPVYLSSLVLTAGADLASVVVRDGATGAIKLRLMAASNSSSVWSAGNPEGILCGNGIHLTFTGTTPVASVEVQG